MGDRLERALLDAVHNAERNLRAQLRYATEHREPFYDACGCRASDATRRCGCQVVIVAEPAWITAAHERLRRDEPAGPPPARQCQLCQREDHDCYETVDVPVVDRSGRPLGTSPIRLPGASSIKHQEERAARAGAQPPSVLKAQRRAAGIDD